MRTTVEQIGLGARVSASYIVLLVLSSLIAAYGLVSNSTATVIGAMIVAPLMGPILGLAMATARGDSETFNQSLLAEGLGVLLVVGTSVLVALFVSPVNIDFSISEILGRTRPTLYDLAIGLAAGLAGAYCTVHPRLQASVAGVAVAVALVPPLAVTGLTAAGALYSQISWHYAFGSFMLFFTNLLTIELAASVVFLMAGAGDLRAMATGKTSIVVKLVLLLLTCLFLAQQLSGLVRERLGRATTQRVLSAYLVDVPWASLDSLEVSLTKEVLTVVAVIGAREEFRPPEVATLERLIQEQLHHALPDVRVALLVRTVQSVYASSTGFHDRSKAHLSVEQQQLQALDVLLRQVLANHPFELESFRLAPADAASRHLIVTVISPFTVAPHMVEGLQAQVNQRAAAQVLLHGKPILLTVRSLLVRSATAEQDVHYDVPDTSTPGQGTKLAREREVQVHLNALVAREPGLVLLEAHVNAAEVPESGSAAGGQDSRPEQRFLIQGVVQGSHLMTTLQIQRWQDQLSKELSDDSHLRTFDLELESRVGTVLHRSANEQGMSSNNIQARVTSFLQERLAEVPDARLGDSVEVAVEKGQTTLMVVRVTVISARPIPDQTLKSWKARLEAAESTSEVPVSVDLEVENLTGSFRRF
ncbi:MAG: DUF389 domain-containing protein [Vulcanimicrobiota bacterium]